MNELTWPLGLLILAIILSVGFVLLAPTGIIARVITTIGNTFQKVIAWISSRFS
jgi:hypothetical protein